MRGESIYDTKVSPEAVLAPLNAPVMWSRARGRRCALGVLLGAAALTVPAAEATATQVEKDSSGVAEIPEFWPGRLQGRPPPTPNVVLRNAPPMVIFPGFGNDAVDYVTPNGLPLEVGLVSALARRGATAVDVVPIARSNWLNVARGLSDVSFLRGNAQPEGPAFAWYIKSAKSTVEKAIAVRKAEQGDGGDARVVLIGHSAGGWLARALCATAGDDWVKRNVRGVVTLGAPHASPPSSVVDQTGGTIPNVNKRQPGAYYSTAGIFYVTVSSAKVAGDDAGNPSARNAFTSYNLVLGTGQGVKGDGFVPIDAAFLDGAIKLTLDCYHSGGSADPWPKDNWYGAEANVDAWLGAVGEQLEVQRRNG